MANDKIVLVNGDSFDREVLQARGLVLVDCWAPWCGPCRMVAPILDELADEWEGRAKIAKLNVDENQEIAFRYQVTSIPTFLLFKDGKPADRTFGAMPKAAFQSFLQRNS
ncbi:MAG TPA: thioredoxin [Thermoanaerobaculia bacterium]|nr:thioredoxin [Thermoanaerobaculia bacterium]